MRLLEASSCQYRNTLITNRAISQNVVYPTVLHTGLRYGRVVPSPFGGRMLISARASLKATVPSPPPASGILERLLMLSAVALIALGIAIALF
jgi:hypothetical protein